MSLGKVVQEESELRNSISQLKSHREDLRASLWIIGDSYRLQLQGCNSVQFSSVTQSCLTLCDPMSCNTPGLPVHHQLPEFTQTHVHRVSDAVRPAISSSVVPFSSCPQSLPASESFPMSQLFAWGGQSIGVSASASGLQLLKIKSQLWPMNSWITKQVELPALQGIHC